MSEENSETVHLIADTNCLMDNRPSSLISEGFLQAAQSCRDTWPSTKIWIPRVVLEELKYRRLRSASTALSRAEDNCKTLTDYSGLDKIELPTRENIGEKICANLESKCSDSDIGILEIPLDSVDWNDIIDRSCWRKAPFEDVDEGKGEKGFRDAMILEAFLEYQSRMAPNSVYLLTNDNRLGEAAKERGVEQPLGIVFKGLKEFETYRKLREKESDDVLAKEILASVVRELWSPESDRDLFRDWDIKSSILGRLAKEYEKMRFPLTPISTYIPPKPLIDISTISKRYKAKSQTNKEKWQPTSDWNFLPNDPELVEVRGDNTYVWAATIFVYRVHEYVDDLGIWGEHNRINCIATFRLLWTCRFKNKAVVNQPEMTSIEYENYVHQKIKQS